MAAVRPVVEPSGCRHCGIPKRKHYQQWKPPVGWHQHTAPTDSQILTRMKARRAARTTTTLKDKQMSTTPPALTTITALHTLLTERPGLAALPIYWSVRPNGDLHADPLFATPGSHDAVRSLAVALGVEAREYETHIPATGEKFAAVTLGGNEFAGVTVYSTGYAPLAVEADVAKVGA